MCPKRTALILKRKNCFVMNHSSSYRQMKVLNRKERESCVDVSGNFLCLAATTSPEKSLPKLDGTLKIKARVST